MFNHLDPGRPKMNKILKDGEMIEYKLVEMIQRI